MNPKGHDLPSIYNSQDLLLLLLVSVVLPEYQVFHGTTGIGPPQPWGWTVFQITIVVNVHDDMNVISL